MSSHHRQQQQQQQQYLQQQHHQQQKQQQLTEKLNVQEIAAKFNQAAINLNQNTVPRSQTKLPSYAVAQNFGKMSGPGLNGQAPENCMIQNNVVMSHNGMNGSTQVLRFFTIYGSFRGQWGHLDSNPQRFDLTGVPTHLVHFLSETKFHA